jgi:hypothetical protein
MGNSTLPTVSDKLNVMASIHNRKLIATLSRELKEKDSQIQELRQTVVSLESKLNELFIQTKERVQWSMIFKSKSDHYHKKNVVILH